MRIKISNAFKCKCYNSVDLHYNNVDVFSAFVKLFLWFINSIAGLNNNEHISVWHKMHSLHGPV